MAHKQISDIPDPKHGSPLIYGFDPLKIEDAKHIARNPSDFPPMRRTLALATVKEARGQTVDRERMIRETLNGVPPEARP